MDSGEASSSQIASVGRVNDRRRGALQYLKEPHKAVFADVKHYVDILAVGIVAPTLRCQSTRGRRWRVWATVQLQCAIVKDLLREHRDQLKPQLVSARKFQLQQFI
jgi:hypothetical protein